MPMTSLIKGTDQLGDEVPLKASQGGISFILPAKVLWTAKGYGFQAMATTAVAALVVRPGTTAAATLYNPATAGKNLVIERAVAHNLVCGVTESGSIWLCLHPTSMAAIVGNDITIRNRTNGIAAGGSSTIFDINEGVIDNGWFPWGAANPGVTALDGVAGAAALVVEVNGRLVVPPGGAISIHVLATTTTNTYCCGFHWFEVPTGELINS